jgi:hypothetical protein
VKREVECAVLGPWTVDEGVTELRPNGGGGNRNFDTEIIFISEKTS